MRQRKIHMAKVSSLFFLLFTALVACSPTVPTEITPALKPAEFVVGPLNLMPATAMVDDSVIVSTVISNTGDITGTYSATLLVNGQQVDSKDISVDPGDSQGVAFQISENNAGNYNVSIGNSTAVLTVYNWSPYTIQYDNSDGAIAGAYVNGDRGHIVQFTPPNKSFKVQKIRIFGATKIANTSELNNLITVRIWDKDGNNLLWSQDVPWGFFLGDNWQQIEVPDVRVNDDFRVEVVTHSYAPGDPIDFISLAPFIPFPGPSESRILRIIGWLASYVQSAVLIGFDYPQSYIDAPSVHAETRSGYSYMGKLIDPGQKRLEGINWLIRVEGESASGG